jgi:hypothetical protein
MQDVCESVNDVFVIPNLIKISCLARITTYYTTYIWMSPQYVLIGAKQTADFNEIVVVPTFLI